MFLTSRTLLPTVLDALDQNASRVAQTTIHSNTRPSISNTLALDVLALTIRALKRYTKKMVPETGLPEMDIVFYFCQ